MKQNKSLITRNKAVDSNVRRVLLKSLTGVESVSSEELIFSFTKSFTWSCELPGVRSVRNSKFISATATSITGRAHVLNLQYGTPYKPHKLSPV